MFKKVLFSFALVFSLFFALSAVLAASEQEPIGWVQVGGEAAEAVYDGSSDCDFWTSTGPGTWQTTTVTLTEKAHFALSGMNVVYSGEVYTRANLLSSGSGVYSGIAHYEGDFCLAGKDLSTLDLLDKIQHSENPRPTYWAEPTEEYNPPERETYTVFLPFISRPSVQCPEVPQTNEFGMPLLAAVRVGGEPCASKLVYERQGFWGDCDAVLSASGWQTYALDLTDQGAFAAGGLQFHYGGTDYDRSILYGNASGLYEGLKAKDAGLCIGSALEKVRADRREATGNDGRPEYQVFP